MHILTKSKNFVRGAAITGSVVGVGVLAVPAAAFAHGGYNDGQRAVSTASQTQSQSQSQQNDKAYKGHSWAWWWQHRHQTCQQRQQQLNTTASNAKSKDTKQLNGLNIVYNGIQDYSTSVTIANYADLKATTDADQAKATAAISGITAPQLNCDNDANSQAQTDKDNGSATRALNKSIKAASDALNTYKHDVWNLFNAAINS